MRDSALKSKTIAVTCVIHGKPGYKGGYGPIPRLLKTAQNQWRELWRRGWDSNPRYGCPYAAFRVRCFRPLSHLSALLVGAFDARLSHSGEKSGWQGVKCKSSYPFVLTVFGGSRKAGRVEVWKNIQIRPCAPRRVGNHRQVRSGRSFFRSPAIARLRKRRPSFWG